MTTFKELGLNEDTMKSVEDLGFKEERKSRYIFNVPVVLEEAIVEDKEKPELVIPDIQLQEELPDALVSIPEEDFESIPVDDIEPDSDSDALLKDKLLDAIAEEEEGNGVERGVVLELDLDIEEAPDATNSISKEEEIKKPKVKFKLLFGFIMK